MDKSVLTSSDIETLKGEARKLQKGEMVIATLNSRIVHKDGETKIVKSITPESRNNEILDFPGVSPLVGEGIKGMAVIDAFKKAKAETQKKEPFSLKKFFFDALEKVETTVNYFKLNSGRIVYQYDEFGRVYIVANDKKLFLNKSQTKGITEDGRFVDIVVHKDNIDWEFYYDEDVPYEPDLVNFDYLYITEYAEEKARDLIEQEEERQYSEFDDISPDYFKEQTSPSNIIDFSAYRDSLDKGKSR